MGMGILVKYVTVGNHVGTAQLNTNGETVRQKETMLPVSTAEGKGDQISITC